MCLLKKLKLSMRERYAIQEETRQKIEYEKEQEQKKFDVKVFVKKELVSSYNRLAFANEVGYYERLKPINYAQTVRLERVNIDYILLMFDNKEIKDISEEKQKELKDLFEKSIEAYEEEAKAFPTKST